MNVIKLIVLFAIVFIFTTVGLTACDKELEQNEVKNKQWVQDSNDGKPFTNYGE